MTRFRQLVLPLAMAASIPAWSQSTTPPGADTVVLRAGDFALSQADYEKLVLGFERAVGAVTTGPTPQSLQSGQEVARLLALTTEARRRKIDQTPRMQALLQVRSYVLLANALLVSLTADMKQDEAGTRALYESEKNNYMDIHARQILVRYQGVTADKPEAKGSTRSEAQAKTLAAATYQKLKSGEDFAALARTNSDDEATNAKGGVLPAFTRGAMQAEFETAAFALPVGGVSEPVKTKYGYHIIQVNERRAFPFERVRATLEFTRAKQKLEEIAASGTQLNDAYFKR